MTSDFTEAVRARVDVLLGSEEKHRQHRAQPITPGMLVRPKFNMKVTLWSDYTTRTCPDGVVRATMRDRLNFNLDEHALVIGVPLVKVRNNNGTGVVMLYLPRSQRFAYAWDSSLKVLQ